MQQIGGHLDIERSVLELRMAEQHLDHTDVHLLFKEVRGKGMPLISLGR